MGYADLDSDSFGCSCEVLAPESCDAFPDVIIGMQEVAGEGECHLAVGKETGNFRLEGEGTKKKKKNCFFVFLFCSCSCFSSSCFCFCF